MFRKCKLQNRMVLGYSVPIILFIGLAGIVYLSTNKLLNVFTEVEKTQKIVGIANTMTLNQNRMVIVFRGYMLSQNPQLLKEYEQELNLFDRASALAVSMAENNKQQQRIKEMVRMKNEYERYSQKILNLVKQGKRDEAILAFRTGEGQKFVDRFKNLSTEFNKTEEEILAATTAKAKTLINNLIAAVAIGALLCLTFSLLAAYWISAGITRTVERATSAIASSSNQIAATIEEQERTVSQQAASVNQTTTTMDELGASSQQTAGQAQAVATAAQQALSLTATGTEAVENTLEEMSVLREKVGAIANEISRLSDRTNQIASISSLVSDLANQTNMLALNAAVEAVRAGEQGKGFGVVASEIRKLADQSKKSAEKINALVSDIQKAISSTVMVTDEGTMTVEQSVKIAQKTAQSFAGVTEAINNVVLCSQQISLSSKQQAIAIEQVVDAMNALNRAAAETASGISQTRIGTQKLNDAAQSLKSVV
ncbi:methyl-accepting chemotaxis protein [Aerosakkonema funiforme]|uniref:methyl-accepting chemotaxis protein n=1 Tax=Aerosakkonema funiforme TaxID=1246630 RepID=UPI0035B84666